MSSSPSVAIAITIAGARFHFLQVRHRLLIAQHRTGIVFVFGGDDHNRKLFVDQRVRAVFHFAGRIAFRVNIRNFLQLERAFEGDRIVNAASQEQEVLGAVIFLRQVFVSSSRASNVSNLAGIR